MPIATGASAFAMAAFAVACGAAAGGATTTVRAPSGPVPSSMYAPADLSIRIDVTVLRGSPLGPELTRAYAEAGLFREAVTSGGIDPMQALELVAVTAREVTVSGRGIRAPRWRIAARHRLGADGARDAIARAAAVLHVETLWRDSQGVSSVRLMLGTGVHALVLDGPAEVVFVRDEELTDVVAVVRDHVARRTGDETIEPALALPSGTVVDASLSVLPDEATALGLGSVALRLTSIDGGLALDGLATTTPGSDPAAVTASIQAELERVRGNPLMVSLGVDGLLERLVLTADPAGMRFATTGSWNEWRAVLALVVAATS